MFRSICRLSILAAVAFAAVGCSRSDRPTDVPTVDAFGGRLIHKGQPVKFPEGVTVKLKLISDKGINFGIPLKPDASFDIGWMPVGKYAVMITSTRTAKDKKTSEKIYAVPGGLEIREGETRYEIELGDKWNP